MAWLAGAAACGPITYMSRATFGASGDIAELRAKGASEMAPYEWTAANEYLRRAQELAGYARFQDANSFAKQAQQNAALAKQVSDQRTQNKELPVYDPNDKSIYINKDGVVKKKTDLAPGSNGIGLRTEEKP